MAKEREEKELPEVGGQVVVPQTMVQMSDEQFERLFARLSSSGTASNPDTLIAMEALRASVEATKMLGDEVRRTVRRSNSDHSHQSALNFDIRCALCKSGAVHAETGNLGHPKPELRYDTYFCWGKQNEEQLTPVEVELYNAFESSKEARDGTWTATIERVSAKRKKLHVLVPYATLDGIRDLPSLEQILIELLYGKSVVDPVLSMQRIAELEARLKALEAAGAAVPASAGA